MAGMRRRWIAAVLAAACSGEAQAVIEGVAAEGGSAVIMLTGRAGFCSATLLSETVAITAAHCIHLNEDQAALSFGPGRQPILVPLTQRIIHPAYKSADWRDGRTSIDLAMVRLSHPIANGHRPTSAHFAPLPQRGTALHLYGYGPSREGDAASAGMLRMARLEVTGHPSRFQVRLKPMQPPFGKGACTGDSGGPVLLPGDERPIGVISWTMGQKGGRCGVLTGVVPLEPHRPWITQMLQSLR